MLFKFKILLILIFSIFFDEGIVIINLRIIKILAMVFMFNSNEPVSFIETKEKIILLLQRLINFHEQATE